MSWPSVVATNNAWAIASVGGGLLLALPFDEPPQADTTISAAAIAAAAFIFFSIRDIPLPWRAHRARENTSPWRLRHALPRPGDAIRFDSNEAQRRRAAARWITAARISRGRASRRDGTRVDRGRRAQAGRGGGVSGARESARGAEAQPTTRFHDRVASGTGASSSVNASVARGGESRASGVPHEPAMRAQHEAGSIGAFPELGRADAWHGGAPFAALPLVRACLGHWHALPEPCA
jgi:hypothetical protein